MFYHTVDSILDALDRNHEAVIAGRLSGESVYAEAAKVIRDQRGEIERLTRERDAANAANAWLRSLSRNLALDVVEYGDHQYTCKCVSADTLTAECTCGWLEAYSHAKEAVAKAAGGE